MKREVITLNHIEGFHNYPNAPKDVEYLGYRHRHIFVIRCKCSVTHNEREIEINTRQNEIEKLFAEKFGKPCEFGGMSCESIAEWLMSQIPDIMNVEVLEDGYGGAALTR